MKIAMVSQSYYPRFGGVTEHTHNLAQNLRQIGHQVIVITSGPGQSDDQVLRIGRNIFVPMNGAMVNATIGLNLSRKLKNLFTSFGFDLIHIQCPLEPTLPLAALVAAMRISIPVVGTFHMTARISPAYEIFGGMLQRYARRLDLRIAVSECARRFAERYFPGDYHVIPNGVDTSRFKPKALDDNKNTSPNISLLYVGRFDMRKQVPLLIDAFKAAYASRKNCRLVLVGTGLTQAYCELKAGRLKGQVIQFAGKVSSEDLPAYYQNCDIFCSIPSGSESFGIVLLEAMSSGCPIICSDIEGYREIVENGVQGLLVSPNKLDQVVDAILKLVDNPQIRLSMGSQGRLKALQYDWQIIAAKTSELYESL